LPEVLLAAAAMQKAVEILKPHIPRQEAALNQGTVVIGTVEGDIHDIGKGIVATMLRVYGFEVHDLGHDVPIARFVQKAREVGAHIVASSALMTTTMVGQRMVEEALKEGGLRKTVKTLVGGAAVSRDWAKEIGADAYAEDAMEAVARARELMGGQ
jgi:dimethylamine corrinoid protein